MGVALLVVLGCTMVPAQVVLSRGGRAFMSPGAPENNMQEEAAMPYEPDRASEDTGQSQVETVRARHERMLMAIDGVMGIGVGRTPIGDDAIVLYLRDALVKQHVPTQIEGYPVETTVTGKIDAYGSPGSTRHRF